MAPLPPTLVLAFQTDRHLLLHRYTNGIREQWVVCLCCGGLSKQHPLRPKYICLKCSSEFDKEKPPQTTTPLLTATA